MYIKPPSNVLLSSHLSFSVVSSLYYSPEKSTNTPPFCSLSEHSRSRILVATFLTLSKARGSLSLNAALRLPAGASGSEEFFFFQTLHSDFLRAVNLPGSAPEVVGSRTKWLSSRITEEPIGCSAGGLRWGFSGPLSQKTLPLPYVSGIQCCTYLKPCLRLMMYVCIPVR